jgi:hypothetical protein
MEEQHLNTEEQGTQRRLVIAKIAVIAKIENAFQIPITRLPDFGNHKSSVSSVPLC